MKVNFRYGVIILAWITPFLYSCNANFDKDEGPGKDNDKEVFVNLELSGKVVYMREIPAIDEEPEYEENPISNIAVTLLNSDDVVYTNPNGIFFIEKENVNIGLYPNLMLNVLFEDTDGEQNGGEFKTQTISEPIRILIENEPLRVNLSVILERNR